MEISIVKLSIIVTKYHHHYNHHYHHHHNNNEAGGLPFDFGLSFLLFVNFLNRATYAIVYALSDVIDSRTKNC